MKRRGGGKFPRRGTIFLVLSRSIESCQDIAKMYGVLLQWCQLILSFIYLYYIHIFVCVCMFVDCYYSNIVTSKKCKLIEDSLIIRYRDKSLWEI